MDMIFGEGPILSGHWYNPSTGDSFTVKDTYFEDNNLYVITTDGRRMNYDMISFLRPLLSGKHSFWILKQFPGYGIFFRFGYNG